MERLRELLERKFLNDRELLELEDSDYVLECRYTKPHNAHYNEYFVIVKDNDLIEEHLVYLKHR
ncbi:hypothetical protein CHL78_019280 [Romboutsia weinsteinii]|uniref:Uncharacterized protein n=1 Tax=Romboutsia weinsteinii TaxID=2020949 RepID=A0A371IXL6_9FIRM|nr:hypothetical protein [Romboutsia weinsteinii]RDY25227.1 hypothetical protein CHL78_019280 [Romboutsia weinsteinii]